MKVKTFCKSKIGLPILSYHFGDLNASTPKVLIMGGVHGDEIEGVTAALGLLDSFLQDFSYKLNLTLIPTFNLDGVLAKQRTNANGVDLNRNLPTKDWSPEIKTERYHPGTHPCSEPENQALVAYLDSFKPHFILSLHSWFPVLNVNGNCHDEAQCLAKWTGYKIDTDIGYPTPGSLGTYAGLERGYSTLTYEIERGLALDQVLAVHVPAIRECLKVTEHSLNKGKF